MELDVRAHGLGGMLLGSFLVETAMGVCPPVAALYITELGFTSFCARHLWHLHSDCNMSWTYSFFLHRDPCKGHSSLVACLFSDIYCSSSLVCSSDGVVQKVLIGL